MREATRSTDRARGANSAASGLLPGCSAVAIRKDAIARCFFFGSDLDKLAKPSSQTVLERVLGIRAIQCYNCPTAQCGSGHDMKVGRAKSEARRCSGNCHARRHPKVLLEHAEH